MRLLASKLAIFLTFRAIGLSWPKSFHVFSSEDRPLPGENATETHVVFGDKSIVRHEYYIDRWQLHHKAEHHSLRDLLRSCGSRKIEQVLVPTVVLMAIEITKSGKSWPNRKEEGVLIKRTRAILSSSLERYLQSWHCRLLEKISGFR